MPFRAIPEAIEMAVLVLPTPPFCEAMEIIMEVSSEAWGCPEKSQPYQGRVIFRKLDTGFSVKLDNSNKLTD